MENPVWLRFLSFLGLVFLIGVAWLLSENRRRVDWRLVFWGVGLQVAFGVLVLRTSFGRHFFEWVQAAFGVLTDASKEGAKFVFGSLSVDLNVGAVVAFQVLPVIIFVSSLAAVLDYLRVTQAVVNGLSYIMRRTMRTSGAETLSASLQVFMGIEALTPLRGYLNEMTRSELLTVMTTFMASIAASVMVAYATFGAEPGHLMAASLMSAPAALLVSKLLVPETGTPKTNGTVRVTIPIESHNVIDAAARGASDGLTLALNVGAMLIAFLGLVFLLNLFAKWLIGYSCVEIMGWVFYPCAFFMGVPFHDVGAVAELLGKKTVLNEFLAYADFKPMMTSGALSRRSITILTYALCGFANPGSLGILLGAATAMIPGRRSEIVNLGVKSLIGGTLANFMTGCIAGMLIYE